MTITITQSKNKRNIWSLIERDGNYIAQVTEANGAARLEGWRIVATGLTVSEACSMRDSLKTSNGVVADLSDLLIWDCDVSNETHAIEEFDTVNVKCHDGIYRTGQIITWNDEIVVIEVGAMLHFGYAETTELISKLEWEAEYEGWLDELQADFQEQIAEVA